MSTTLTAKKSVPNTAAGVTYLNPLTAIANGAYRVANPNGKLVMIFYMPASSTFDFSATSPSDSYGRAATLAATIATAGANPEIRVLGPYTPNVFNQKSGADTGYFDFTIANLTGAVKVAVLSN